MLSLWHLDEILRSRQFGRMHDESILKKLKESYQKLRNSRRCESLLRQHLTEDVFDVCSYRKTFAGATLMDVIRVGITLMDREIGIAAPDADAYKVFEDLFRPVIKSLHKHTLPLGLQPKMNFGEIADIANLDPSGKLIMSIKVRCVRNLKGYNFTPLLSEEDYLNIERKVCRILNFLAGDLHGTYHSLTKINKVLLQKLVSSFRMFKEGDDVLHSANSLQYWPNGRGIFINDNETFMVWLNEEDHLRIISMDNKGNLRHVTQRLLKAMKEIESKLLFVRDDYLGYLTFCPSNIGPAIKVSIHLILPNLSKMPEKLSKFEKNRHTRVMETEIEGENEEIVYEVSAKSRVGMTEYDTLINFQKDVLELLTMEAKESD